MGSKILEEFNNVERKPTENPVAVFFFAANDTIATKRCQGAAKLLARRLRRGDSMSKHALRAMQHLAKDLRKKKRAIHRARCLSEMRSPRLTKQKTEPLAQQPTGIAVNPANDGGNRSNNHKELLGRRASATERAVLCPT
jgi:hypothetical protein